ncbi:MAG: KTSC domain-containing protein [Deltaproteobacteria bacterium]|nr:KTSC domain-containing protein [Deltaproteobacteria bacterium]
MIVLKPTESSMISHVGYDEGKELLRIRFSRGAEYEYREVPKAAHDALMKAKSIGKYFHQNVKGSYDASRVQQTE